VAASQRQSKGTQLPIRRHVVQQRTPLNGEMGGTQTSTTTYESSPTSSGERGSRQSRNTRLSNYNPATVGAKATSGTGTLEAEFLLAMGLLVLLMFSSTASFSDKIMSTMKRGTLTCLLFFVLSLVSSAGPNAARVAKGFGALVIVGILVTSPMTTVFTDIDNIIKNDWAGTDETGGGSSASADTGTSTSTSGAVSGALSSAATSVKNDLANSQQEIKDVTGLSASQIGIVGQLQNAISSLLGKL
jgi:hypothetical protein